MSGEAITVVVVPQPPLVVLPAGAGLQGVPGPQGPAGPQGPKGEEGSDFPSDPLAYYILAKS